MSLTLEEARERAAAVSDVSYALDLDLRDPGSGRFGSTTTVRFRCATAETFLELTDATDLEVELDGDRLDLDAGTQARYDGRRLHLHDLTSDAEHVLRVSARLPLVTDGEGMHTLTDPVDGATYVGAYLGMDVAQKVFCCFDQNDLKAPVTTTVTADPAWTVLANGRLSQAADAEPGTWRFAATPPIPTALVTVVAGPWHSRTWTHAGLPFGWHVRASLAADLDRDFDEMRRTTEECFAWYAEAFDEPYGFDSYDQVLVPGLNWGAMEHPGCVLFAEEFLPRGRTTDVQRVRRASVIAHEMSHMWFGDLVTMTWWEDTWLQESFADYLGYRVAAEAAGFDAALVEMEVERKITGYDADVRRSTHAIAPRPEDVPDVSAAATNFDMISYAKGAAALQQLVVWLGDDAFLRGVNTYLTRHRWGNATLADFVAALDEASDRDVRGWVETWLRRPGFDTVRLRLDGDVPVLSREGEREHRVGVTALDDDLVVVERRLVDLPGPGGSGEVRLDDLAGRTVVPNSHGETFARLDLDPATRQTLLTGLPRIDDAQVRAVLWASLSRQAHEGSLDVATWIESMAQALSGEREAMTVGAVLDRALARTFPLLAADEVAGARLAVASACATGLAHATDVDLSLAFADGVARCSAEPEVLLGWLDADAIGDGVGLPPALRWRVVQRLAALGQADAVFVEAERRRDGSFDGALGSTQALAARPTPEAKEAAWAVVSRPDVDNRHFSAAATGLWELGQSELVAPFVDRYRDEAPTWAARGPGFAQVVGQAFPRVPLSAEQLDGFEAALDTGLAVVLRRQWQDRIDDRR